MAIQTASEGRVGWWMRMSARPFSAWVVFGGLIYLGLAIFAYAIPLLSGGEGLSVALMMLAAVPLLASFAGLTAKRWGFAVTVGVGAAFLVIFGLLSTSVLSNPANPLFWVVFSGLPILLLVAAFSFVSLRHVKTGLARKRYLASPRSSGGLVTLAVVGFVIGGLLVGNIAATTITRLLDQGGQVADVRIVRDAASAPEPFVPATLTIAVSNSVTWFNGDAMVHTVTSDTGGFDSLDLVPGASFSHTFTQPGTYTYHCTPHPWMRGTVVVQP